MAELPSSVDPTSAAPGTPGLVGLPVERHSFDVVHEGWPTETPSPPESPESAPRQMSPVPLIGAVPFGGSIVRADVVTLRAGETALLGNEEGEPSIMEIWITIPQGDTLIVGELITQRGQISSGFTFDSNLFPQHQLIRLPVRSVILRNNDPFLTTRRYAIMVIAYRAMR